MLPADEPLTPDEAPRALGSQRSGLTTREARARLAEHGPNQIEEHGPRTLLRAVAAQARNPFTLLLVGAAAVGALARDWTDAIVILAILIASTLVSFFQDRRAEHTVARLRARVQTRSLVMRDGSPVELPAVELVPGDVIQLGAGALVPADAILLEASDFFVNEALLTGEAFPVEKRPGAHAAGTPLAKRSGWIWSGTSVRSGAATAIIVRTGKRTEIGRIAHRLVLRAPETDFERGLRRYGLMLARIVIVLVVAVFAVNLVVEKPVIDSLLFAIALAVGIAPEMLPAIVTIMLAHGARTMAKRGVIVKRLTAIESFGSMDVLCTDKTGTLTEGTVRLVAYYDADGASDDGVLHLALANACLHTGLKNPLDEAILERDRGRELPEKVAEIPYDFARKRLSVVVEDNGRCTLITKGAFVPVLALATCVRRGGMERPLDEAERRSIVERYESWSTNGTRVLALATRSVERRTAYHADEERELCLEGFLLFDDVPKRGIADVVAELARGGVAIKIVSGDNRYVAAHVAGLVGLDATSVVTGQALDQLTDEALPVVAARCVVFAEVDPRQKERIVLALRKAGSVVGYMGDGINDAPALHAADVSISVEGATDVAREAADLVLLQRDLEVLRGGMLLGRRTFTNTLKYLYTTESANFGNMLSVAIASLFLPFLPLTASQILLNNFLSDLPAMAIATDSVDEEQIATPRQWDLRALRRFMLSFGAISSVFDLLTFGVLIMVAKASPETFRTGWFVESLLTELTIALVVRTWRPFYRSRPGRWLLGVSVAVMAVAFALPYVPGAWLLGFVPLPAWLLAIVIAITLAYVATVEIAKRFILRRGSFERRVMPEAPAPSRGGRARRGTTPRAPAAALR